MSSLQNKQRTLEPNHCGAGLQRSQDVHGDELKALWWLDCELQNWPSEVSLSQLGLVIRSILIFNSSYREKKRERERDDLWRKMQDLSLRNAAKEGISLGQQIELSIYDFPDSQLQIWFKWTMAWSDGVTS